MKVPLVSSRSNDHTKACFKRCATAVPYTIDLINSTLDGSGATFEIIQFRILYLVRHGN